MAVLYKILRIVFVVIGTISILLLLYVFLIPHFTGKEYSYNFGPGVHWYLRKYAQSYSPYNKYSDTHYGVSMRNSLDKSAAQEIRDYFQLDTLYSESDPTWQKTKKIACFVASNIWHSNAGPNPEKKDAVSIWETFIANESGLNCRMHSILLYELLSAAGIEARYITCLPKVDDGDCHVVNQVWLPELQKWAMIDSDMSGHYATNKKGIPLSLSEIRKYYATKKYISYHKLLNDEECLVIDSYYKYMAKNCFYFSCWEDLHFGQESANAAYDEKLIYLVPLGYTPDTVYPRSEIIDNDNIFWAAPL